MTTMHKLTTIVQAVELGTKMSTSWFRGHAEVCEALAPRIWRPGYQFLAKFDNVERSMSEEFKRLAPNLTRDLPVMDDHVGWLFLMQYHGLPTRLLDWSQSVLIGLYFAVSDKHGAKDKADGELWVMYPDALNEGHGLPGLPFPGHPLVNFLSSEYAHTNPPKLAEELGLRVVPYSPLALLPPITFSRIANQLGAFTIHPRPEQGQSIPESLMDPKHLASALSRLI